MLPKTVKRTLAEDVAISIRSAIVDGRLNPGERLREEALAEMLGVSRGPVHEALAQLEREGLVIVQRNRRTYVARLSREDLDEVYSLRMALEVLAVQQAVRQPQNEKLLSEMQRLVDLTAEKLNQGLTEPDAAELDVRFHDTLCRASGHRRLMGYWSTLRSQVHVLMLSRNVADSDFRALAISSHQAIIDAVAERDEARAVKLIRNHVQGSYQRLLTSYDDPVAAAPAPAGEFASDGRLE